MRMLRLITYKAKLCVHDIGKVSPGKSGMEKGGAYRIQIDADMLPATTLKRGMESVCR